MPTPRRRAKGMRDVFSDLSLADELDARLGHPTPLQRALLEADRDNGALADLMVRFALSGASNRGRAEHDLRLARQSRDARRRTAGRSWAGDAGGDVLGDPGDESPSNLVHYAPPGGPFGGTAA